jgi:hypothetical protein
MWRKLLLAFLSASAGVIAAAAPASASAPTAPASDPQGATISCGRVATYSDTDGTFTLQHQCGGTTAPWGYTLSAALCAGATTNATEAGMMWALNGATQGTQAFHIEPCGYQFHGTFNPARDNSHIAYSDVITWNKGNAHYQVQFYGSFILSSNGGGVCGGLGPAHSKTTAVHPDC